MTADPTAAPQPATPGEALDLDAIEREWLVQCGPCDFGQINMACQCPPGDHRAVIQRLAAELRRVRGELARYDRQLTLGAPAADRGYQHGWSDACEAVAQAIEEAFRHVDVTPTEMAATARATAPAADPDPDEPVTLYAVLSPEDDSICVDPAAAQELATELSADPGPYVPAAAYRAYRLVPLSTTPPAGTEAQ